MGVENPGSSVSIGITVDVNGYNNKPNQFGKDVFMFEIVNNVLYPMGAPNTSYPASTYCKKSILGIYQGFGCMYYVMQEKEY